MAKTSLRKFKERKKEEKRQEKLKQILVSFEEPKFEIRAGGLHSKKYRELNKKWLKLIGANALGKLPKNYQIKNKNKT